MQQSETRCTQMGTYLPSAIGQCHVRYESSRIGPSKTTRIGSPGPSTVDPFRWISGYRLVSRPNRSRSRPLLLSARAIGRPGRMTESRTSQERTRNRSARGDERGEDGRHDRVEARSATASRSAAGVPIRKDRLVAVLRPREEYWFLRLDPPETDEFRCDRPGDSDRRRGDSGDDPRRTDGLDRQPIGRLHDWRGRWEDC